VKSLQRELSKLLAQKPEEKPQGPMSVVSLKAKRAADTRLDISQNRGGMHYEE